MNTKPNITSEPNTFQTDIVDPSGAIHLCQWFSLNDRSDGERQEVAAALETVILAWKFVGRGDNEMSYFAGKRICPVCPETEINALVKADTCPTCGYVYRRKVESPVEQACIDLIEGTGGLDDFEYYEMATMTTRREIGVVMWTVRCIANNPDGELAMQIKARWEEKTK